MKTIIERGASWTLEETRSLVGFWGADEITRGSNAKRTKDVYERIADKLREQGFERTWEQVKTRIFNMIAEYRRIRRDPNPERIKKCMFYDALRKLEQAKQARDKGSGLDLDESENPGSPCSNTISSEKEESISESEANEVSNNNSISTNNNGDRRAGDDESITIDKDGLPANSTHASGGTTKKVKLEKTTQDRTRSYRGVDARGDTSATESEDPVTATTGSTQAANNKSQPPTAASNPSAAPGPSSSWNKSLLLPRVTIATTPSSNTPATKIPPAASNTPSYININSTKLPILRTNQLFGHTNGSDGTNANGTPNRIPATAAIAGHQLYQAPVNTFDVTSSALLIDRMFAHLSRESENMREWIALEKERLALERTRRQQEAEREARRERILCEAISRNMQDCLAFISRHLNKNATENLPELNIPPADEPASESTNATETDQPNT